MMTSPSGSSQPHGFVVPAHTIINDDAADPAQSPDREDDESARAEALGYADPEDAPPSTAGTPNEHGPEDDEGSQQAADGRVGTGAGGASVPKDADEDQRPL